MTLTAHPDVLASLGVPEADARLVNDSHATADVWGHLSHRMLRLPWYVARLRSGVMKTITIEEIVVDTEARGRLAGVRLPDKTSTNLRGLGAERGVAPDDSMPEQVAG